MTDAQPASACLNCDAPLTGRFCAECGQRAVPAYPTLREYAGDAWEEMSGFDGRFARSIVTLLRYPGALTVEILRGRRVRYIKPLRLYLSASVVYFVLSASGPVIQRDVDLGSGVKIHVMGADEATDAERAAALEKIKKAPGIMKPLFLTMLEDPEGFRSRVLTAFPKMIFALVPVLALILGLFYRGRRYMQHLTFALHVNAAFFIVLTIGLLARFSSHAAVSTAGGLAVLAFIAWYAFRAQRVVYGDGRLLTLAKSAGVAVLYSLVAVPSLLVVIVWAAYFR